MKILLLFLMTATACSKVMLQSTGAKKQPGSDPTRFNLVMFASIVLCFLPHLLTHPLNGQTVVYGVAAGLLNTAFQTFYMKSFSLGKMSLTVLITNCGILITVAYSVLAFHEGFSFLNGLGLVLVLISLWLNTSVKGEESMRLKNRGKWLVCVILSAVCSSLGAVVQISYGRLATERDIFSYVAIAYLTATIAALILLSAKRQQGSFALPKGKILLLAVGAGLTLGAHQCLNTYTSSIIEGKLFFPIANCCNNLALTLLGVIFFHEKFTQRQKWGIPVSVVAILLLSV